jgi:hypothetical protein
MPRLKGAKTKTTSTNTYSASLQVHYFAFLVIFRTHRSTKLNCFVCAGGTSFEGSCGAAGDLEAWIKKLKEGASKAPAEPPTREKSKKQVRRSDKNNYNNNNLVAFLHLKL